MDGCVDAEMWKGRGWRIRDEEWFSARMYEWSDRRESIRGIFSQSYKPKRLSSNGMRASCRHRVAKSIYRGSRGDFGRASATRVAK